MIRGVIFDLDGVLVTTDELHFQSWIKLTNEEGIRFDRRINERLRGVSRMESLAIVLERSPRAYSDAEKQALADRKNGYYQHLLTTLTPASLIPGSLAAVTELRRRGLRVAVGSSSKNTRIIMHQLDLLSYFDVIVDGNDIERSKPDPQVFLLAAERLGLPPAECLVIEDAVAGVESARRAGMTVFGIGTPEKLPGVARLAPNLAQVTVDELINP
jgi:beta-phosphoglucomutase